VSLPIVVVGGGVRGAMVGLTAAIVGLVVLCAAVAALAYTGDARAVVPGLVDAWFSHDGVPRLRMVPGWSAMLHTVAVVTATGALVGTTGTLSWRVSPAFVPTLRRQPELPREQV
jgi:hypothetical protein